MLRAGEQVGQYEIISELGRGGMATVYKAYHAHLDRQVAIKVMHQTYATDDNFTERFKREAQIVARLDHAHIVPVYDYNEYNGMPYLVMKIIQGRSLKQMLIKKPPKLNDIIRIMTAIADATTYAHKQGILHRDIKPSNIVVDADDIPYLADFGLARIVAAGESTMSADVLLGTPNYMSPEQARGLKNVDYRSDLYSLGIVLYELVVGQVPFASPTPLAVIQDHIYTPLPRPSLINPDIPPRLEQVLRKALAKAPNQRYSSANEMMQDFAQAIQDEHIESLAENRKEIADASLAQWREEYINDDSLQHDPLSAIAENDSLAQSVRNLAQPSIVEAEKPKSPLAIDSQPIAKAQDTPIISVNSDPISKIKNTESSTATYIRNNESNGRFWMMAGVGVFILSLFLMIAVVLNASNTILSIVEIAHKFEANKTFTETDDLYKLSYHMTNMTVTKALEAINENPDDALNYLLLAQAYYSEDNIDMARSTLNDGRAITDDVTRYLATTISITRTEDPPASLIYGILLWNLTQNDTSETGQIASNTVSEFLYDLSLSVQDMNISRDNSSRIIQTIGRADTSAVFVSPITKILIASNHVHNRRIPLATNSIESWNDAQYEIPIGKLVSARHQILIEDTDTALDSLNQLVEASTTPPWIVTIAEDLINVTEE